LPDPHQGGDPITRASDASRRTFDPGSLRRGERTQENFKAFVIKTLSFVTLRRYKESHSE
jgi:hypothetical protein